jgi:hypothetical protein
MAIDRHMMAAGLLGPLAVYPAIFTAVAIGWLTVPAAASSSLEKYMTALRVGSYGVVIAYGVTWLYGVPLYRLLARYGLNNLFAILIGAMIPSFLLGQVLGEGGIVSDSAFFAYFSAWVSVFCWALAVWLPRRRSNNSLERDAGANAPRPSS